MLSGESTELPHSPQDSIGYPVYHSVHDNFFFQANLTDPSFSHFTALGLVWGKVALLLATSPVVPFDPRDYSSSLSTILSGLKEEYGVVLSSQNITLSKWPCADTHTQCVSLSLVVVVTGVLSCRLSGELH